MIFHDNKEILDKSGKVNKPGLFAAWARYASVFVINETPVQSLRLLLLTGILTKANVLSADAANVITAVVGVLAATVFIPLLFKGSKRYQKALEQKFLWKLQKK